MVDLGFKKLYNTDRLRPWWRNPAARCVWIEMLATATHKDTVVNGIQLKAGQALYSIQGMSEATGLTVKQVRTALQILQDAGDITIKTSFRCSIATLTDWNARQGTKSTVRTSKPAKVTYHTSKEEKAAKNDFKPSDKDREYIEMLRAKEAERAAEKMKIREQRLAEMSARENAC